MNKKFFVATLIIAVVIIAMLGAIGSVYGVSITKIIVSSIATMGICLCLRMLRNKIK